MDVTTVQCGKDTRDKLRAYRDEHDLQNYDEAIRELLSDND
jgi:hypothetical protein